MARNVARGKLHVGLPLLILFVLGLTTCDGDGGVDVEVECPSKETRADKIVDEGRMMVKTKQAAQARACFKKAVEVNPKYVPGLLEAGQGAIVEHKFALAVSLYSKALKMEVSPEALNNMAIAYSQMGAHVDAVATYKRVIQFDEFDAVAFYNLGTALEAAKEFKDAAKAYREAIEIDSEEAKYYNNLGGCLAALNKTETAERSYKWAIKIDKRFADAYFNLGNFLLAQGRIEESIERLQQCLAVKEGHEKCQRKLKDANEALERKMEDFKAQVDEAIKKAEKMQRGGRVEF